jgi:hypothetical protein
MPFCPACGSENASGKKFCTNCGSKLTGEAGPGQAPVPSPGTIPAIPRAGRTGPSGNRTIIIGIVVAIALVAAGILFVLPMMKNGQNDTNFAPAAGVPQPASSPVPVPTQPPAPVAAAPVLAPVTTVPGPVPSPQMSLPEMKTYSSSRFGFTIDYPSGWEVNEKNQLEAPSLSRYDVIEFYSPSINRCNTDLSICSIVRSTVMVEVETRPGTKEIADYFIPEVARITSENGAQITKRDSMFKLSGIKAYRLDYTAWYNKNEIKLLSAYTLINDKVYIVTYRAYTPVRLEEDQFELYYNTVMDMYTSFHAEGAVTTLQ